MKVININTGANFSKTVKIRQCKAIGEVVVPELNDYDEGTPGLKRFIVSAIDVVNKFFRVIIEYLLAYLNATVI